MELDTETEKESRSSSMGVPSKVLEGVTTTLSNIDQLKPTFDEFLSLSSDPLVLPDLPPLHRAHALLLLAKTTSLFLSVRLRCSGVYPDHHPIKGEIDRLSKYEEKLERYVAWSKAPLKPTTTLNHQAAARFIEHSLPDLTSEQRQSMRAISNSQDSRFKYSERNDKKRKYQSSEAMAAKSVREAAQEFLEKAARELLGETNGRMKGPLAPVPASGVDEN